MAFGDIVTNLTVDKRQFQSGLQSAATETKRFGDALTSELSLVQKGIAKVSAEYAAQGREGGTRLEILVKKEAELSTMVARRTAIIENARLALKREGDQAVATTQQMIVAESSLLRRRSARGSLDSGALSSFGTSAAFGLSDAFSAGQYGGLRGAAVATANNLPILGMAAGQIASGFTRAGGAVGLFARAVAPLAGPAGLVASIALPLGALLIPKLFETKRAADESKQSLESWAATFRNIDRDVSGQAFFSVERRFRSGDLEGKTSDSLVTEARDATRERLRIDAQIEAVQQQRAAILEKAGVPDFLTERLGSPTAANPNPAAAALASLARSNPGFKGVSEEDRKALDDLNEKLKDLGEQAFQVGTRIKDSLEAMRGAREKERQTLVDDLKQADKARDIEVARLEKERKERVTSLRTDLLGIVSPNQSELESITGTLEKRRDEITRNTSGKEREGLLSLANQAALSQARGLRSRLGSTRSFELASVVTKGNAADFLNLQRATLQRAQDDPTTQAVEKNNEQNREIIGKLDKLIDELRKAPVLKPTSIM